MPALLATDVEAWSNVASNAAQVGAIVVAGWWAYTRFIRQREEFPRATLEQVVTHRELDGDHTFLRVTVKVDNVSAVLLRTETVRTDVFQVLPVRSSLARGTSSASTSCSRPRSRPCSSIRTSRTSRRLLAGSLAGR